VFEAGAWEMVSMSGTVSSVADRRVAAWAVRLRRRAAAHAAAAAAVLVAAVLLLLAAAALPPRDRAPLCAAAAFTAALWYKSIINPFLVQKIAQSNDQCQQQIRETNLF
jgi:hypothetical protein